MVTAEQIVGVGVAADCDGIPDGSTFSSSDSNGAGQTSMHEAFVGTYAGAASELPGQQQPYGSWSQGSSGSDGGTLADVSSNTDKALGENPVGPNSGSEPAAEPADGSGPHSGSSSGNGNGRATLAVLLAEEEGEMLMDAAGRGIWDAWASLPPGVQTAAGAVSSSMTWQAAPAASEPDCAACSQNSLPDRMAVDCRLDAARNVHVLGACIPQLYPVARCSRQ